MLLRCAVYMLFLVPSLDITACCMLGAVSLRTPTHPPTTDVRHVCPGWCANTGCTDVRVEANVGSHAWSDRGPERFERFKVGSHDNGHSAVCNWNGSSWGYCAHMSFSYNEPVINGCNCLWNDGEGSTDDLAVAFECPEPNTGKPARRALCCACCTTWH